MARLESDIQDELYYKFMLYVCAKHDISIQDVTADLVQKQLERAIRVFLMATTGLMDQNDLRKALDSMTPEELDDLHLQLLKESQSYGANFS